MSARPNPTLATLGPLVTGNASVEAQADARMAEILQRVGIAHASSAQKAPGKQRVAEAVSTTSEPAKHPREVNYSGVWKCGKQIGAERGSLKRFEHFEIDTERVVPLDAAHPAVMEGRTLFPGSVVSARESPRFLVSGHNSRKLGAVVEKGPWAGFPIYQLSLEERKTCPRSCKLWEGCYGNSMHLARRHDHADPEFMPALDREVRTLARSHPKGFVVRLHTLGDFYSLEYLELWASLLVDLENLHIFGYTARREDADDEASRELAHYIRLLSSAHWKRFAIRFSNQAGPEGTIVVDAPLVRHPHVIMCPAQTGQTDACATCGLCWSEAAREKTIGFLRHGRKRRRTKAEQAAAGGGMAITSPGVSAAPAARADQPAYSPEEIARNERWRARYEDGESIGDIMGPFGNRAKVRKGIIAAGGIIRTREEAVSLLFKRQAMQARRLAAVDGDVETPPRSSGAGRARKRRGKIEFDPGEQRRLIDEAIAKGRVTVVGAAYAAPVQGAK